MQTDYTTALFALAGLVVVLTGMTAYLLTRPSDLGPTR
jgi:hypothetical protein